MKRVVVYARYSCDNQTEQSIEGQLRVCQEYAARNQMLIVENYIDRAMSGTNDNRPDFQRMLTDSKKKMWEGILVYKFDRFSRNSNDGIIYKSKAKHNGVSVLSVNQPIDPNNVLAEQIENILLIIADIDNAMRRHKCQSGMESCIRRGEWYSRPPLGYDSKKVDKTHILTVNDKGRLLKLAFEWVANEPEITQAEIIRRLKARGLDIPKQRLSQYLRNRFYCGEIEHKYLDGEIIEGKQEPLISKALFQRG
jgi:DNA invertase Pin-like site-specific DNA recombinase